MGNPVEFYFDFSSPYGYFAAEKIEAIAAEAGRAVDWKPFMLGATFQKLGTTSLVNVPLKGDYSRRDMARTAAFLGVPFTLPTEFPAKSIAACRAFYWLRKVAPDKAAPFAKAAYRAYFVDGRHVDDPVTLADVARALGIDPEAMAAGMQDAEIKQTLFAVNEEALARGVFGSPFIFVDGEAFWGSDRLDQVARWLKTGGW